MKKVYLSMLAIATVATLTITGCTKDSTTSDSQVAFAMQSDNATTNFVSIANSTGNIAPLSVAPNATVTTTGTASVVWTSAVANISKFKLEAKKDGTSFEIVSNSLTNVDLLSQTPATVASTIPVGNYTNVEVHVVLAKTTGTAYPLVLKGTYTTKAGNQVPIEFDFNDNVEIVATAADIKIDGTANVAANLSLHLNQLLASITTTDVDQTTRSTIGTTTNGILITGGINPLVYAKIIAAIAGAGGSNITTVHK